MWETYCCRTAGHLNRSLHRVSTAYNSEPFYRSEAAPVTTQLTGAEIQQYCIRLAVIRRGKVINASSVFTSKFPRTCSFIWTLHNMDLNGDASGCQTLQIGAAHFLWPAPAIKRLSVMLLSQLNVLLQSPLLFCIHGLQKCPPSATNGVLFVVASNFSWRHLFLWRVASV